MTRIAHTVDVVVVGAGLSGLQAATDIHKAGLSYVVLEARDQVGGKTCSVKVRGGEGMLDLGAAWINDTTHPHMYNLFLKYGLDPIIQKTKGDEVFRMDPNSTSYRTPWPELPPMGKDQRAMFEKIMNDMDVDCNTIDLADSTKNTHFADVSVSEYLREKGATDFALGLWTAWIHDLTGVDPNEISLIYWLDYAKSCGGMESLLSDGPKGAQYMTNRGGNQTVSIRMASELRPGSVHLKTPVVSITQGDQVQVETFNGDIYHCQRGIVSVPTPLYRHITFVPPLPADKQEYAESTQLGPYSKCILVYSQPWWRDAGFNGSFIDLAGPVIFSRDVSSDEDGMYAISCLIGSRYARVWERLPKSRRAEAVKQQLASMVGPEFAHLVQDTIEIIEKIWTKEQWIEGVPCPMPAPGGIWPRLGNALRKPFGKVYFVGTETAFEWKGYMEGAVRAGARGAQEVIGDLSSKGCNGFHG